MLYPANMMFQFEENRDCNINHTIKKAKLFIGNCLEQSPKEQKLALRLKSQI